MVNYTHQFIFNLEVKKWIGPIEKKSPEDSIVVKAKNQLLTIQLLLGDWFSTELIGEWSYISALYCQNTVEQLKSEPYIAKGVEELKNMLANITLERYVICTYLCTLWHGLEVFTLVYRKIV